jgi:2-methylisocitrate lyase-like PEP mutase family enzyme
MTVTAGQAATDPSGPTGTQATEVADVRLGDVSSAAVARAKRECEAAGVAAIQLEDRTFPKRCSHLPDKPLATAAVFKQTMAAAPDSRPGPPADFVNLVGMADWFAVAEKYATHETRSWEMSCRPGS